MPLQSITAQLQRCGAGGYLPQTLRTRRPCLTERVIPVSRLLFPNTSCLERSLTGNVRLMLHFCFQPQTVAGGGEWCFSRTFTTTVCSLFIWVNDQQRRVIVCSCLLSSSSLRLRAATFLQHFPSEVLNVTFSVGEWGFARISVITLRFTEDTNPFLF